MEGLSPLDGWTADNWFAFLTCFSVLFSLKCIYIYIYLACTCRNQMAGKGDPAILILIPNLCWA